MVLTQPFDHLLDPDWCKEELLDTVNNLVEYPVAVCGRFEEEFLDLPEEVLTTSMKAVTMRVCWMIKMNLETKAGVNFLI